MILENQLVSNVDTWSHFHTEPVKVVYAASEVNVTALKLQHCHCGTVSSVLYFCILHLYFAKTALQIDERGLLQNSNEEIIPLFVFVFFRVP